MTETTERDHDEAATAIPRRTKGFVALASVLAIVAVAVAAQVLQGTGAAILVLAGGALLGTIAVFWESVRVLSGEVEGMGWEGLVLGTETAEDEKKQAVLRALKDLEYERKAGKISADDYEILVERYRTEAKQVLRLEDERYASGRAKAEELVKEHLAAQSRSDSKAEGADKASNAKAAEEGQ